MIDISTFSIFGFTFHTYGLIVGLALIIGVTLVEKVAKENNIHESQFWQVLWWVIIPGILGARLYHVLTDWYLYIQNPTEIFFVWNGGLSIIGGVIGGVVGLMFFSRSKLGQTINIRQILDLSVFGLPVAQIIGRWGNWVNHELYGGPTSLPWKLYIPPVHRLSRFSQIKYYHPLFAYEQLLLIVFVLGLWFLYRKKRLQLGTGLVFAGYVWYYSLIRFGLDFVRLDRGIVWNGLGLNQWVMLVVWAVVTGMIIKIIWNKKNV